MYGYLLDVLDIDIHASQGYWISNFEYPDSNMDVEYSDSGMEYPTSIWTRLQSLGYDFNFFFF
jgi:hypothetical protein